MNSIQVHLNKGIFPKDTVGLLYAKIRQQSVLGDWKFSLSPRYSLDETRLSLAVLGLPGHHTLGLEDLLDLGQLV